jgi:PadR family transcriptional regulator, regulatory protein AphA
VRTNPAQTTQVSVLTATECAVLGLLVDGKERSGYDLKKAIDGSVGYFWGPAKSQIYAVLPRLVEADFAKRRDVVQAQRPDKQLYRITSRGRQALRRWIETAPNEYEPARNPLLLKLFFGEASDPETLLEHVRDRRRAAEQLRAELLEIDRQATPKGDFYPALTRKYGLAYADAILGWAREAERALEARP